MSDEDKEFKKLLTSLVFETNKQKRSDLYNREDWDLDYNDGELVELLIEEETLQGRTALFEESLSEKPKKPKTGTKMANKRGTVQVAKSAVKLGLQQAVADEAGDIALNAMIKAFPALKAFTEDDLTRDLLKVVSALGLSYVAEVLESEFAPRVNVAAELIVTVASQRVTKDRLKAFAPAIKKIAGLVPASS